MVAFSKESIVTNPVHLSTSLLRGGLRVRAFAVTLLCALTVTLAQPAEAQTFAVAHTFTGGGDGFQPEAGLAMDAGGNLYGTTKYGAAGYGTVYKLSHHGTAWILSNLHEFAVGFDGAGPEAPVVFGPDGSLYGSTVYGGGTSEICTGGCGILFNLQPSASAPRSVSPQWNENTFHHFLGTPDGANPTFGNLVFDSSGTIYGTSPFGGQMQGCNQGGCGTVFKAARSGGSWTESVVYAFTGERDGAQPYGNITFDSNGSLYSTTHQGGVDDLGTVFQLTPTQTGWVKTTVHDFTGGSDGSLPYAGLISDSAGNLYGTTSAGGSSNAGVVFELTRNGSGWDFRVLHTFIGCSTCGPIAPLAVDATGNLYGTTLATGGPGDGVVFELSPSEGGWIYSILHQFTGGSDGAFPVAPVLIDGSGNLYGTAMLGGDGSCGDGCGVVWEITR
jgi:uncharacterized repeat protein (TIGR03803 family)